ncbi:hypothetical protein COS66_03725 [Candidatus Berkelbacteria bacterium CG06_land_8_20_14_3_00_43_10]|nr:MAG: hypothetical protein COS66_03725 [Candidatus Berkelbacteria bacterium CG06_land_8_20_14_3_00_43_10]
MKVEYFATTNQKGQVVIPKKLRDELHISDSVLLHILKRGGGFYVYPVKEVIDHDSVDTSYGAVLAHTQGKWGKSKSSTRTATQELTASQSRKDAW